MKPVRFQLKRVKGYRLPLHTRSVARPTRWGNPFHLGPVMNASQAVACFRWWLESTVPGREVAAEGRRYLKGKNVACWCKEDAEFCHGTVLVRSGEKRERMTSPVPVPRRWPLWSIEPLLYGRARIRDSESLGTW